MFSIRDEASVVLRAIAAQLNSLQATVDKTAASLKEVRLPKGVAASIEHMDKAMGAVMLSAGKLETSMADIGGAADRDAMGAVAGFGKIDASIATTQGKLAALRAEMRNTGVGSGVGRSGGGGGSHGGRRGMFHASSPGAELPGGSHISPSQGSDGFWATVAFLAGADVVKNVLEQGGNLETQKKLLGDRLGRNAKSGDVESATAASIRLSTGGDGGIIGTTPAENLKGITDLLSVTPDLASAIKLYPQMMRAAKDLEEVSGGRQVQSRRQYEGACQGA